MSAGMHLLLAAIPVASLRLSAPPRMAVPPAVELDVRAARSEQALRVAADFFVGAFWAAATSHAPTDLNSAQLGELADLTLQDMEDRYAELVGARRLKSALLVARRSPDGPVVGCVGCELAVVSRFIDMNDRLVERVETRKRGEAMFAAELAELGGRARNELRGMPLQLLATALLEDGTTVEPVLANLAVASSERGTGLGVELCARVDDLAKEWGFGSVLLQVEEGNVAARKLYEKVGYKEVWRDEQATATRAAGGGDSLLTSEGVTLINMRKEFV